jgi:hypothetical protein
MVQAGMNDYLSTEVFLARKRETARNLIIFAICSLGVHMLLGSLEYGVIALCPVVGFWNASPRYSIMNTLRSWGK